MTAYTSTQTGNWNDAATWGGGGYPNSSGDTATISASHDVTILTGVAITCGAITTQDGSSGDYTRILIVGTGSLDLAGAVSLGNFSEINLSAGSTLDLNGQNITHNGRVRLIFIGSSGSRISVISTGSPGRFLNGDSFQTLSQFEYVDFSGLGNSILGNNYTVAASTQSWQYCTFTDCGSIGIDPNSTRTDQGFLISHCDFRNPSNADPETAGQFQPDMWTGLAGTGTRIIEDCTFETSGAVNGVIKLRSEGLIFRRNVVSNYKVFSYSSRVTIQDNFFNNAKNVEEEFFKSSGGLNAFDTMTGNYFYYTLGGHPMGFLVIDAAGITVTDNVFEMGGSNNGADWFLFNSVSNKTFTLQQNVWIGIAGSPVTVAGAAAFTLLDISRNTMYINNLGTTSGTPAQYFPLLLLAEQSGLLSGTVNIYDNLCIDPDSSTARDAAVDLVANTAGQITLCDYNVGWGYPVGASSPPIMYRHAGGTLSGLGANDFSADPDFVDKQRTLAVWDDYNGGPGTAANAISEMLKLNGTGGSLDADYTVAQLVTWVKAGFVPQNSALQGSGRTGDDIGAIDVVPSSATPTFPGMAIRALRRYRFVGDLSFGGRWPVVTR